MNDVPSRAETGIRQCVMCVCVCVCVCTHIIVCVCICVCMCVCMCVCTHIIRQGYGSADVLMCW